MHKLESLWDKEGWHAPRACYHARISECTEDTEGAEERWEEWARGPRPYEGVVGRVDKGTSPYDMSEQEVTFCEKLYTPSYKNKLDKNVCIG